ncbi:thioredoxin domain-containing protein [Micrococcaceae bacterium RIT802]|nr:thioredoxin domain-containing protein [Micrococcaceae bacterium RIT 802]
MASNAPRPSKAERTATAREQARKVYEQQQAASKRKSLFLKLGVVVAVVVIIAVIATIIVQNNNNNGDVAVSGPAPAHGNQYGGYTLSADGLADTPAATVDMNQIPEAATGADGKKMPAGLKADKKGEPVHVVVYADMSCPICKQFEAQYGAELTQMSKDGDIELEYRIATFLDRTSPTNYSSRAANALACVADAKPEAFNDYLTALFEQQPEEGSEGLPNAKLADIAEQSGAGDISSCADGTKFRPWAQFVNTTFNKYEVGGTPAVYVNGKEWDMQSQDLKQLLDKAIADNK